MPHALVSDILAQGAAGTQYLTSGWALGVLFALLLAVLGITGSIMGIVRNQDLRRVEKLEKRLDGHLERFEATVKTLTKIEGHIEKVAEAQQNTDRNLFVLLKHQFPDAVKAGLIAEPKKQ